MESDCRIEDIPHSLSYNMVVTQMAKDEKTNHQVLKQALAVVQDNLSTNISQAWQEISDLLWSWHNYVSDKYPIISDHALYRSLNGIISCVPDEIDCNDNLLKFVFSELLNEYSPFISTTHRYLLFLYLNYRGKSLLESWVTTFLPDWQPPLIFVRFISNFLCM